MAAKKKKNTRAREAGVAEARAKVEAAHLMYNLLTARHFMEGLIDELTRSLKEFEGE